VKHRADRQSDNSRESRARGRPSLRRLLSTLAPGCLVLACAVYFALPIITLARYSLQNVPAFLLGRRTLFKNWSLAGLTLAFRDPAFWSALRLSMTLAIGSVALTLVLLVPTAVWTHLRLPRARPFVEFLTVLPYVVPPIALVAGIVAVKPYARWFLNSDYSLVPFYTVLALPFTYRSIDAGLRAIDLKTLVDASRSLGAGAFATLWRVLLPNLGPALISSIFLTAAVTIGEFAIADTLLKETLPRYQATFVGREPQGGYALNLMVLLLTTLLFVVLSWLTRRRPGSRPLALESEQRQSPARQEESRD